MSQEEKMSNWKAMMDDMEFEDNVLTEVRLTDTHVELFWNSMGFGYERSLAPDFEPKAGMKTKLWGTFGSPVRGLMIDNRLIYYMIIHLTSSANESGSQVTI